MVTFYLTRGLTIARFRKFLFVCTFLGNYIQMQEFNRPKDVEEIAKYGFFFFFHCCCWLTLNTRQAEELKHLRFDLLQNQQEYQEKLNRLPTDQTTHPKFYQAQLNDRKVFQLIMMCLARVNVFLLAIFL